MLVDPYTYVRFTTLFLGVVWTLMGLRRMARFGERWRDRLIYVGLKEEWLRRQVIFFALRTTVLDPINLSLILLLIGTWMLRSFVE
jgi:hypothetical protein